MNTALSTTQDAAPAARAKYLTAHDLVVVDFPALLRDVSAAFGVSVEEVLSKDRHPHIAAARHVVAWAEIRTWDSTELEEVMGWLEGRCKRRRPTWLDRYAGRSAAE